MLVKDFVFMSPKRLNINTLTTNRPSTCVTLAQRHISSLSINTHCAVSSRELTRFSKQSRSFINTPVSSANSRRKLIDHAKQISTLPKRRFLATSISKKTETSGPGKVVTDILDDNILTIGMNRPEKRNAVDRETAKLLVDAFERFEQDDSIPVAILHGCGGTFCSGFDLSTVAQADLNELMVGKTSLRPMGPTMMRFSKPVIAAVDGYAVAGGMELALMADLRVMEKDAAFGVLCRRFGVPLLDGGTIRLPALIGLSRAMDLILTGREVKADEAVAIGLAFQVCEPGTALGTALALARRLRKFPQQCMLADRRSAYHAAYDAKSYEQAFDYELKNGLPIVAQESVPGAAKFTQGVGRHGSFDIDQMKKPYHK